MQAIPAFVEHARGKEREVPGEIGERERKVGLERVGHGPTPDRTVSNSGLDALSIRIGRRYTPDPTIKDSEMAVPGSALFPRLSHQRVVAALKDTPVVMLTGPRQAGKTTLARAFVGANRPYLTLDDDTVLAGAAADPAGFIRNLDGAVIDEVQRAPALLRAIKAAVDADRRPGRFLLTGSANVLALPQVSESLAGRMEAVALLPLSQLELRRRKPTFLRSAFAGKPPRAGEPIVGAALVTAILAGGYPEMLARTDPRRRQAWAREYVNAIVQRDVRDIAEVEKLDRMTRLLQALAQHSGRLVNLAQVGGQIGLDDKTVARYLTILEHLFLLRRVEPWFRNRLKRLIKTPKLHFLDSGLLAVVLGATAERIAADRALLGPLLETFVYAELTKQTDWFEEPCALHHFRDKDQDEVDVVIESGGGAVVGVEVKAAASVSASDFKGLRKLAAACGDEFKLGVVLYDGENLVPFGERLYAAPVGCLWG